jgi:hypothetical protein
MPHWLHAVRSTTIDGGPDAVALHAAVSSAKAATRVKPARVKLGFDIDASCQGVRYFSTISQPCISRCSAEQNSVQ